MPTKLMKKLTKETNKKAGEIKMFETLKELFNEKRNQSFKSNLDTDVAKSLDLDLGFTLDEDVAVYDKKLVVECRCGC